MEIPSAPLFALLLPLLAAACNAGSNATTGTEFLEKFKEAVKEKEAKTLWKMLSKKTQDLLKNELKQEIQKGYHNAATKTKLLNEFEKVDWHGDEEKDLREIDAEELYLDRLQRQLNSGTAYREFKSYRFVEEKPEGNGVLLTVRDTGDRKIGIVLILEDDYLKYDQELTMRHATRKK